MRGRVTFALIAALVSVGALAGAAAAAVTDRVRIGSGSSTTRFFSAASFVVVTSPAELDTRRSADARSGTWEGPPCEVAGRPELASPVSMSWSVYFSRSASPEAAARDSFTFEWETVEQSPVAVPHVVAGRTVGTIPGVFVVTDSRSDVGYHESAVGFPLGRGVFGASRYWSRGNALVCTVRSSAGSTPIRTWHRAKAREAVMLVQVDGNLPPARVRASKALRGATGRVTDSFGHPNANATVRLERRAGSRWRRIASARTRGDGTYAIVTRARGRMRVVAIVGAATATSRPFRR
jgi:hypothetical protein